MIKSVALSALYVPLPGTLYTVVEPCEVKSVTARYPRFLTAVPVGLTAAEATVDAVLAYEKDVALGTLVIV